MAAVTAAALAIAIPSEGIRRVWYLDPANVVTVCHGHTGPDIDKTKTYTIEECKTLLTKEMQHAIQTVDTCRPGLPVNVLAAFGDAVYNLGPTIACDSSESTAAKLLAAGRYADACNQLPRWNKTRVNGVFVPLPGLTRRRELEQQLCLTGRTG